MNNKRVLIVENSENQISKKEDTTAKKNEKFLLEGIFTEFDIENRNKRIYTSENFVPVMENTLLAKKAKLGVVYGEYDHPDVFDISGKNLSHAIESLTFNKELNRIDGSIALMNTFYGKQARAIIEDGYPLFVSSRAAGVTDNYGRVQLKELFTYDIVVDPGFASARVQPAYINESLGYSSDENTNYRIYEMSEADAQRLFTDNKNDIKTMNDYTKFEEFLKNELAKSEFKVQEMISKASGKPAELTSLLEQVDLIKEELNAVNKFLAFLQPKMTTLINQNSKLVEANKKLETEVNETVMYTNHVAKEVKKSNKIVNSIDERLNVNEKFTQYVAEHAKANILFSNEIANEQTSITEMLEYVAENVNNNKEFLEYVAEEVSVVGKFAENTANETSDTQEFLNYVANEKYKDEVYLNYVAEKVDGLRKYQALVVDAIKENNPVNESNKTNKLSILEEVDSYLGIDDEQEMMNNIVDTDTTTDTETETETPTEEITTVGVEEVAPEVTVVTDDVTGTPLENTQINLDETETPVALDNTTEVTMLNKLVKMLTSDDTGIIIEIKPGGNEIVIQKSGSDETFESTLDEVEEVQETENFVEKVNSVLAEIKKQKALENQAPHFFTFLNESQISDFKGLNKDDQAKIILEMNDAEYFSTEDVIGIISKHLNDKALDRAEALTCNLPEDLKESWNALSDDAKNMTLNESKYFNLKNVIDIHSFWNTRQFAKAVKSPGSVMLNESANNTLEENTEKYEAAFLAAYKSS